MCDGGPPVRELGKQGFGFRSGGKDWMPLYKVPLLAGTLFRHQYNNWWYETDPEPGLNGRKVRH